MTTNVDRALRGYVNSLERIAEQHQKTISAAERRATESVAVAQDKLITAKQAYDKATERAGQMLHEVTTKADAERAGAELRELQEFDREMRRCVGAPEGARLVARGARLELHLGDGRAPVASAQRVGSPDQWMVEGGDEPQCIVGGQAIARRLLWERCRPVTITV